MIKLKQNNKKIGKKRKRNKVNKKPTVNSPSSTTTIHSLPIETLTQIFQYLPPVDRVNLEKVCTKWKSACRDSWRNIRELHIVQPNIYSYSYRFKGCIKREDLIIIDDDALYIGTNHPRTVAPILSRVGRFITTLIVNHKTFHSQFFIPIITKYCHNIEVLDLKSKSDWDKNVLSDLFRANEKLQSFRCHDSLACIEALPFKNWKSLRLGGVCRSDYVVGKVIELIKNTDCLEEFQTDKWTSEIMDEILKHQSIKAIHFISMINEFKILYNVVMLKNLTSLAFGLPFVGDTAGSDFLSDLSRDCANLKKLTIFALRFPKGILKNILELPQVETLEIHCGLLRDEVLMHLIGRKNLMITCVEDQSTQDGFLEMIANSRDLESLNIIETGLKPQFFPELVWAVNRRSKVLKIVVNDKIYGKVRKICEGSQIRVMKGSKGLWG